jgi:hypothetical protein
MAESENGLDSRRKSETVDILSFLAAYTDSLPDFKAEGFIKDEKTSSPFVWRGKFLENKIQIYHLKPLIFDICFKRNNKKREVNYEIFN